jgi:hypothetical protein
MVGSCISTRLFLRGVSRAYHQSCATQGAGAVLSRRSNENLAELRVGRPRSGGACHRTRPSVWPPARLQLILLVARSAIDSPAFGLGVAFVPSELPLVRRIARGSLARAWITFLTTAWLLGSWWPHDNMHKRDGAGVGGLIVIEYLFHFSMVVAGEAIACVLARALASAPTTKASERGLEQRVAQAVTSD